MGRHTIVLMQPTSSKGSRRYMDYESISLAMDGVCHMFEKKLAQDNPSQRNITYDAADLFKFIDNIPDISCLVYSQKISAYIPYNRDWVKNNVYSHLKKLASQ